jgi:hypothetical protein
MKTPQEKPEFSNVRAPFVARTLPRSGFPGLALRQVAKRHGDFKIVRIRRDGRARVAS